MWHMTCDMWHATSDTWHVARYTWHVTCDMWHVSLVTCHMSHVMCHIFFFFTIPPKKNIGPMIRIGREIQCLPYAGFFFLFKVIGAVFWKICISCNLQALCKFSMSKIAVLLKGLILLFFTSLFKPNLSQFLSLRVNIVIYKTNILVVPSSDILLCTWRSIHCKYLAFID